MNKDSDTIKAVQNSRRPTDTTPALAQQIQESSLSILLTYVDNLFSTCDDLFFDLSSRAASNNEQNLYFESMRELRVKKNGVVESFKHNIEQNFTDAIHPQQNNVHELGSDTTKPLSLVHEDEIEQKVAITGMTSKARANNQEALYQLTTRLDYLVPTNSITENNNPVDPQQLCQSFASACDLLSINIKAKIILFKQFDRLVINRVANIYSHANDLLIKAGVIPNITPQIKNPDNGNTAPKAADSNDAELNPAQAAYDFAELSQLLTTMRQLGMNLIPDYRAYSNNPGPIMNNEDLLATLTLLQAQLPNYSDGSIPASEESKIREIVDSILQENNPLEPQAVKESDEDTINLVAMFFDFVLDDNALPISFQALIGRLQIPVLKTALKDKSFFSDAQHPARQLVNALASASIGWDNSDVSEIHKDKTYQHIASIIQDITENSFNSNQIFIEKLEQLNEYISRNEHRSSLIEKRTHQAAEGQAKTKEAKQAAQDALFFILESAQLPSNITNFLVQEWQQFLVITHLKHTEESSEWMDALQLVQDLVWACRPQTDEKSKLRFEKIKNNLYARMEYGIHQVANTSEECATLISTVTQTLEGLHKEGTKPEMKSLTAEHARMLGHVPGSGSKSWKEMSALERQQARHKSLTYEYIKKAESLPLNTWLDYQDNIKGRIIRCKLAGRIEASDSFIFVNRFGFKVMERMRKDFAYDLQQKQVTLLETGQIFDRAMSVITSNLRQLSKNNQPHSS